MNCSKKKEDQAVIKELQKEVERQGDLIYQLRQENASLRTKLANEKDMCQVYAERLRVLQNQYTSHLQSSLEKNAEDNFQPLSTMGSDRDGVADDGVALTIMTQLQTQHSEESWMDESTCYSEREENQIASEMKDHGKAENNNGKQRHGLFFQKGNQKQHRRSVSLRQLQARLHCIEQFCHSNKDASSPKACRQRRKIEPVQRKTGEDAADCPSRMGWSRADIGRKLNSIKESYVQQTDIFDDDLKFMREVLNGTSHAPEMDIEVELDRLMKDFKVWRKQFEDSVKSLHASLKTIHPRRCASVSPRRLESKKGTGRKTAVTASLGKFFHRSANGDLRSQDRNVSGTQ